MNVSEASTSLSSSGSFPTSFIWVSSLSYTFYCSVSAILFLPFQQLKLLMSLSFWIEKSRESLCQSNVPCKHHSSRNEAVKLHKMSICNHCHFFTSAFFQFIATFLCPLQSFYEPNWPLPNAYWTVPLVAFTTAITLSWNTTMPSWSSVFLLDFSPSSFSFESSSSSPVLRLLFPQILMFFRALYILSVAIFAYSPGFHGLPLRKISGDFRPSYRTEKKYDWIPASRCLSALPLKIMSSLPEFCLSFLFPNFNK